MKGILFFVRVFIFVIAISYYPALAQETPTGPKMVLKERVFDFGKVRQGEIIEHSFWVLNKGDQPLKIIGVKPG